MRPGITRSCYFTGWGQVLNPHFFHDLTRTLSRVTCVVLCGRRGQVVKKVRIQDLTPARLRTCGRSDEDVAVQPFSRGNRTYEALYPRHCDCNSSWHRGTGPTDALGTGRRRAAGCPGRAAGRTRSGWPRRWRTRRSWRPWRTWSGSPRRIYQRLRQLWRCPRCRRRSPGRARSTSRCSHCRRARRSRRVATRRRNTSSQAPPMDSRTRRASSSGCRRTSRSSAAWCSSNRCTAAALRTCSSSRRCTRWPPGTPPSRSRPLRRRT